MIIAALFLFLAPLFGQTFTTVTDTIYLPVGLMPFTGTIEVTAPALTYGGATYARQTKMYIVTAGAFSEQFVPNDAAIPANTTYTARYFTSARQAWTETWSIPTSLSPLKINQVRTSTAPATGVVFPVAQINLSTPFSMLYGNSLGVGTALAPNATTARKYLSQIGDGTNATAPAWVDVNVGHNANDYSFSQISGVASTSQLPSGIATTKLGAGLVDDTHLGYLSGVASSIQTQLDGKVAKGTVALYADDYCAVPGTYNHTCLSGAVAAAPASGFEIILGPRNYTWSAGVTITAKTDFRIRMQAGGKVTFANNLNTTALVIDACKGVQLTDWLVDGNRANQSADSDWVNFINNSFQVRLDNNNVSEIRGRVLQYTTTQQEPYASSIYLSNNIFKNTTEQIMKIFGAPSQYTANVISTGNLYEGADIDANGLPGGASDGPIWLKYAGENKHQFINDTIVNNPFGSVSCAIYSEYAATAAYTVTYRRFSQSSCGTAGSVTAAVPEGKWTDDAGVHRFGRCVGGTPVSGGDFVSIDQALTPGCLALGSGGTQLFYYPFAHGINTSFVFEIVPTAWRAGSSGLMLYLIGTQVTTGTRKIQYSTACGGWTNIAAGPTFGTPVNMAYNYVNAGVVGVVYYASIPLASMCNGSTWAGSPTLVKITRLGSDAGDTALTDINLMGYEYWYDRQIP